MHKIIIHFLDADVIDGEGRCEAQDGVRTLSRRNNGTGEELLQLRQKLFGEANRWKVIDLEVEFLVVLTLCVLSDHGDAWAMRAFRRTYLRCSPAHPPAHSRANTLKRRSRWSRRRRAPSRRTRRGIIGSISTKKEIYRNVGITSFLCNSRTGLDALLDGSACYKRIKHENWDRTARENKSILIIKWQPTLAK